MNLSRHEYVEPPWTEHQMDAYEQARSLLSEVIAAYSARIASTDAETADQLRAQRAAHLRERQSLTAGHTARVEEIRATLPGILTLLRERDQ
ncbi:hypothetical protein ABZ383_22710 [Streptomyces sp. NPDC005900]|uniref:hypothetical protein n=1 Tax=Streptomyces sp. NPDC005900 TaxID=3154569 RepID=UPI003407FDE6